MAKKMLDKYIKVYHYTKYAIFIANPPLVYLALVREGNPLLNMRLLDAKCRVDNFAVA